MAHGTGMAHGTWLWDGAWHMAHGTGMAHGTWHMALGWRMAPRDDIDMFSVESSPLPGNQNMSHTTVINA